MQPVHELAEKVHAVGGRILVDAAQLAPHRPIDMRPHDDPGHLDFVALSAHKMYAPYGTGALVGRSERVRRRRPTTWGAARCAPSRPTRSRGPTFPTGKRPAAPTFSARSRWRPPRAPSPTIGLDRIAAHERQLTRYAIERLAGMPGLQIHGPTDTTGPDDKVGVIPFTIAGIDHGLVAAVLGYEHGVGVRSGCFCAHPYIAHLLHVDHAESMAWVERVSRGDKRGAPGMVRISFGCYNDRSDVDRAVARARASRRREITPPTTGLSSTARSIPPATSNRCCSHSIDDVPDAAVACAQRSGDGRSATPRVRAVPDFLVDDAILLVFLVIGVGAGVGSVRVRGISLGPAAALFVGLAVGAIDDAVGGADGLGLLRQLGLVLFTYTVGLASGPTFLAGLRRGGALAVAVTAALVASLAGLCAIVAWALDLSAADRAGLFAGSTTNTPSLQAAAEAVTDGDPVVAYSLAYPAAIASMIAILTLLLGRKLRLPTRLEPPPPSGSVERLINWTVNVTTPGLPAIGELRARYPGPRVQPCRARRSGDDRDDGPTASTPETQSS